MTLNIEFDSHEELITFLHNEKGLIFLTAYNMISKSIDNGDNIAVVANLTVNNYVFTIQIEKIDFVKHLNKSLIYFENVENYEICQKIKSLIDFL